MEVTAHPEKELNHQEFNLVYKALENTVNLENWTVTPNQSVVSTYEISQFTIHNHFQVRYLVIKLC